ncbi:glycosyltransferase 87 family protein [Streptomyces sp. NPDC046831]|uniref:glycosyltransferase 87 family protein n=1 Tax=Streptomyces sp. NPDC046831 TaxID=3154805 RepID=UPI0033FACA69
MDVTGLVRVSGLRTAGRAIGTWLTAHAGRCLAASLTLHVLAVSTQPSHPLDLRVYREASAHLLTGGLYDYALHTRPPIPELPFTYPPFAALLFLPLSRLPWSAGLLLWRVASVAALFVISACAVRLLRPRPGGHHRALSLLWTAAGLWLEPVRHTLDLGQVNLLLGAVVLAGLTVSRTAVGRGAAVGLAAAVKLTPAVGGLYLLATRQWRAAVWAAVAAGVATAAAWCVAPDESARYWTGLVTDTRRVGPVWSVRNQSLRGALYRLLGQDGGATLVWWAALALATLGTVLALRAAARRQDPLGVLVAAELYGLLVCPVSWSHHWIWCLPAMIWLVHGPHRESLLARVTLVVWTLAAGGRLVPQLIRAEDHLAGASPYPALLAWPGSVYAVCAALTLLTLASRPVRGPHPVPAQPPGHQRPHGRRVTNRQVQAR